MYQLRPVPDRAEDYNDYFTRAERFIETYAIRSSHFADLKLTFVSIL